MDSYVSGSMQIVFPHKVTTFHRYQRMRVSIVDLILPHPLPWFCSTLYQEHFLHLHLVHLLLNFRDKRPYELRSSSIYWRTLEESILLRWQGWWVFVPKGYQLVQYLVFFWVYFLLSFSDIDEYFVYVVPLGMDEIFVSCEVFFMLLMSSLLRYTTLIHYQNRSEERSFDIHLCLLWFWWLASDSTGA